MTSTYAFETADEGEALFLGERQGYVYGRACNPTQALFEERIASLEGAEAGLAVASGMAAISSTLWSLLQAGDRVLIDHTLYGNTFALFMCGLPRFGIEVAKADFTDPDAGSAAVKRHSPKLVFFESPGNPTLRIIDIAAVAGFAHQHGALVMVDNTFATPALQHPKAGSRPCRALRHQIHQRTWRPARRRRRWIKEPGRDHPSRRPA
jgi:methionine-gamma-lyase